MYSFGKKVKTKNISYDFGSLYTPSGVPTTVFLFKTL